MDPNASNQIGAGMTLNSRNLQNEYATTYQHGGNHSSIGTIYQVKNSQHATAVNPLNLIEKASEGPIGVHATGGARRVRPFSGVYRMNANKSLVGGKSGSYQH